MTTMAQAAAFFDKNWRRAAGADFNPARQAARTGGAPREQREDKLRRPMIDRLGVPADSDLDAVPAKPAKPARAPSTAQFMPVKPEQQKKELAALAQLIKDDRTQHGTEIYKQLVKMMRAYVPDPHDVLELKQSLKRLAHDDPETAIKLKQLKPLQDRGVWGDIADAAEDAASPTGKKGAPAARAGGKRKGKKPEQSLAKKLTGKFGDVMEAFLGPAGPILHLAREFIADNKDVAIKTWTGTKSALAKVRDSFGKNTKTQSHIGSAFKRFLPGLFGSMSKFAAAMHTHATGALGQIGGLLRRGGRFMRGHPKISMLAGAVTGAASAGAINSWFSGEPGSSLTEGAMNGIVSGLQWTLRGITGLFGSLGSSITQTWTQFTENVGLGSDAVSAVYDDAKRSLLDSGDTVGKWVQSLFVSLTNWAGTLWSNIKNFGHGKTAEKVKSTATNYINLAATGAGGGDDGTSQAISALNAPTPVTDPKQVIKMGSDVDFAGLNPSMRNNVLAMATEYNARTGKKIKLNSAFRSSAEQAKLFAANPHKAARPGSSMHEFGMAVDISAADGSVESLDQMGLLSKYGFTRPVASEAWHVEPMAIQSAKASIRKNGTATAPITAPGNDGKTGETEGVASNNINTGSAAMAATTPAAVAPSTASATAAGIPLPTTPAVSAVPDQVAANTDGYTRVRSEDAMIETDVQAPSAEPLSQAPRSSGGNVSVESIPLYLGDMGMIMLNLRMAG